MQAKQFPRSKDELIEALDRLPVATSKVQREVLDQFVETIRYRNGGIAHMEYTPIKSTLNTSEFQEFLTFLGISDEMFAKYKDAYCASYGAAGRGCAPGDDYCNPSLCTLPLGINEPKVVAGLIDFGSEQLRLIIPSWDYHWERNVVGFAQTTFNGTAQYVRPDGTAVHWNLIESWAHDDCGATSADTRWYKRAMNTDTITFGWGTRNVESQYVSAFLRFTNDSGVYDGYVSSTNCT